MNLHDLLKFAMASVPRAEAEELVLAAVTQSFLDQESKSGFPGGPNLYGSNRAQISGLGNVRIQELQSVLHLQPMVENGALSLSESFSSAANMILLQMLEKRKAGVPLQYITGSQMFWNHRYQVTPDVLIPRQETEVLLVECIQFLKSHPLKRGVELGLGSGILSIELLAEFSYLTMVATEVSMGAISVAQRNARQILGEGQDRLEIIPVLDSLQVLESVIASKGEGWADFLISNPPYLDSSLEEIDAEVAADVLQHEPKAALFSPVSDASYFYRCLAVQAQCVLVPGGVLLMEVPHQRANQIQAIFNQQGWKISVRLDLTGRPRVLIAQLAREVIHG